MLRPPLGYAQQVIGTAIELHFDCPRCERPVHANALTTEIPCSNCDYVTEFGWDRWKDVLEDSFDEIPDYAKGRGGRSQAFVGSGPNTDIVYSRFDPYCFECKTDFDASAAVESASDSVECSACGKAWNARPPSPDIRTHFPQIRYLFAEDAKMISDAFGNRSGAPQSPAGGAPVVFACPACGGGLRVDGSERMVPCEHCESSVYLPDDLWRRLHPVQTKRRWFIWWDQGDRARDPERYPTEDEAERVSAARVEPEELEAFFDDGPIAVPAPVSAAPSNANKIALTFAAAISLAVGLLWVILSS
jgi:DNA-directed RNA polymerase subunit RPC12/RpoP